MKGTQSVLQKLWTFRKLWADPLTKLKSLGFKRVNTAMWNAEYKAGRWNFLDNPESGEFAVQLLDKYAPNPRILDLGCGTAINMTLPAGTYQRYHGVDISDAAIEKARSMNRKDYTFEVADISAYETKDKYDAVLLREVLYYLPPKDVPVVLRRAADALAPGGVVIVQLWNILKYEYLVTAVRNSGLPIVDELRETEHGCTYILGGESRSA